MQEELIKSEGGEGKEGHSGAAHAGGAAGGSGSSAPESRSAAAASSSPVRSLGAQALRERCDAHGCGNHDGRDSEGVRVGDRDQGRGGRDCIREGGRRGGREIEEGIWADGPNEGKSLLQGFAKEREFEQETQSRQ